MTLLDTDGVATATEPSDTSVDETPRRSWTDRLLRVVRGPEGDPAWARPLLVVLLAATAALYSWNLTANGWANAFYSAAAQAGSRSWRAFFFGSFDAANWISVDKPPAALWPMVASARVFGLSSWSILFPQVLMGVATVGVVYAAVKRYFGAGAGLVAGAVMAVTPVAVLMFRYNNPDALLTLLMALAAWAALVAVESGRLRWYALCGAAVGFGFLTKQLQVLLVVPPLAAAGLLAAPGTWWPRVRGLLVAGVAMVVAAGWWPAAVQLTPAAQRPFIGGSQHNSIVELTVGYNGLGRLDGRETGSVGRATSGTAGPSGRVTTRQWGHPGPGRLFGSDTGGQIAWLLPAALVALAGGLWSTRRRPRTDMERASLVLWGGWLVVTGGVFSLMAGIFHAYYTVALAPAVAALVGVGAALAWQGRHRPGTLALTAATVAACCALAVKLAQGAPRWSPWLVPVVVVLGAAATTGLLVMALAARRGVPIGRWPAGAVAGVALAALVVAPTAWSLQTVRHPRTGSLVAAGPNVPDPTQPPPGSAPPRPPMTGSPHLDPPRLPPSHTPGRPDRGGGLLDASRPTTPVVAALRSGADGHDWVAAVIGSMRAAGYQLASGEPVMAVGGYNGTDPSPTLAQFQQLVHQGRIRWFVGGAPFGGQMGGSSEAQRIYHWVRANYTPLIIGGTRLYDLSAGQPTAG